MPFRIAVAAAAAAIAASSPPAIAQSASFGIKLRVGVNCTVRYEPVGQGQLADGRVNLGNIRELCNAQHGYQVLVRYAPGSLKGATIRAGNDEVVLNGSGEAILSQAPGPRIQTRAVTATPGKNGFDADYLQFSVVPA